MAATKHTLKREKARAISAYHVVIGINAVAVGEEEVRTGFARDGRLDPADRLSDGPELERADTGGGQEGREHHVVPRRDAYDVVEAGVDPLHEPAPGPSGSHHHYPGLLVGFRWAQPGVPGHLRLRLRAEMRN